MRTLRFPYFSVVAGICLSLLSFSMWAQRPARFKGLAAAAENAPTMATSRAAMGVDVLQQAATVEGYTLPEGGLTGKGVLVGVIDTGVEYNHINFRDPLTGTSRIRVAMLYRATSGEADSICEVYTSPAQIDTLTTDNHNESHGTLVVGVAAGSYTGVGQLGIAPQSDLVVAGLRSLKTKWIIHALQRIFAIADSLEQPCVVNLSLANSLGWKDGYNDFCLVADSLTDHGTRPGRVVVMAAGNNGNYAFGYEATLPDALPHYSLLQPATLDGASAYICPGVEIMAKDTSAFALDFLLYDTLQHQFTGPSPFPVEYFDTIVVRGFPRRYCCVECDTCRLADYPHQLLAVSVKGEEGASFALHYANDYGVTYRLLDGGNADWWAGTASRSINDMCCTPSVLSVGAYSAAVDQTNYLGNTYSPTILNGAICSYSSYGLTDDGTPKPDVIAPGHNIVTSYSSYYDEKITYYSDKATSPIIYKVIPTPSECQQYGLTSPARTYYWLTRQGTSLSAPMLTGAVALWLQCCPSLSTCQVRSLLQETSDWDAFCEQAPHGRVQAGMGKVDAKRAAVALLQEAAAIAPLSVGIETVGDGYDLMGRPLHGARPRLQVVQHKTVWK